MKMKQSELPQYEKIDTSRFVLTFDKKQSDLESWMVFTVERPKRIVKWDFATVSNISTWTDLIVTFVDTISPSAGNALYKKTHSDNFFTEKMTIGLEMLDPVMQPIEKWEMICSIQSVDYGELSYATDADKIVRIITTFKVISNLKQL